jgi:glycosyltransferase involved in cell wall biosynthesis
VGYSSHLFGVGGEIESTTTMVSKPVTVSIVVPALNEAARIEDCLRRLRSDFPDCELVVVDGGSTDATFDLAARHAPTVRSAAGRATQMNAGAVLPVTVTASARRLIEQGPWHMTVLMQLLKLQYFLGVDPERIHRRYEAGTRCGRRRRSAPAGH